MKAFAADATGATAIEYGLITGLIAVVILTALDSLRTQLIQMFVSIANAMP